MLFTTKSSVLSMESNRAALLFNFSVFNLFFRAELNRQKQHSLKLQMQIQSDYKTIAEV